MFEPAKDAVLNVAPVKKEKKGFFARFKKEPNQETLQAIREVEAMQRGEIPMGKSYESTQEMFDDIWGKDE